jgi:hypothetical protein
MSPGPTMPQEADPCGASDRPRHRGRRDGGPSCRGWKHAQAVTPGAPNEWPGVMPRYAAASASVRSGASSRPPRLTCASGPRRSGSLLMSRSVIHWRCVPLRGHGCESGTRAKPPSRDIGGGRALSRKRAQNRVLALGRLISFGFRKERHQADSSDAPLTSTPTTTISTPAGRAFPLPS